MTTLDQAFIKAFSQQDTQATVVDSTPKKTSPRPNVVASAAVAFAAAPAPVCDRAAASIFSTSLSPAAVTSGAVPGIVASVAPAAPASQYGSPSKAGLPCNVPDSRGVNTEQASHSVHGPKSSLFQQAASAPVMPVAVAELSVSSSISSAFRGVLESLENPPAAASKSDIPVHATTLFAERQLKTAEPLDTAPTFRTDRLETFADTGIDLSGQVDAIAMATAELTDELTEESTCDFSPLPFPQPSASTAPLSSFLRQATEEPTESSTGLVDLPEEKASVEPPEQAKLPEPTTASEVAMPEPMPMPEPVIAAEPLKILAPQEFKPALQVERFTWPKVCRRLISRSPNEFDRLADALLAACAQGKKVLGITSCRQGEGATTLLLCAARRLADHGVKLALVDADLARPRLAKRLGVQPERGWNETAGEADETHKMGDPLELAAIEAVANGLTLAPIKEPDSPMKWSPAGWACLAESLKTLRTHFEMTIVDLGPLENIEHVTDSLQQTIASELDAVLLIRNQRITTDEQLTLAQRELSAAGIALAGLIENFIVE